MNDLQDISLHDHELIPLRKRIFNNDNAFWTAYILWFILFFLAIPLLSTIIPDMEVVVVLIILVPILYLLLPILVIQLATRHFSPEETALNTLWQGETADHERKYVLYHVGFVWAVYFVIAQFGLLFIMLPLAIVVFVTGLRKGWLLQTDGKVDRMRDYFTRLDRGQILLLLFMFVGLAGGMAYIGYVIIFVYIAAIIIHDQIKPSALGCRGTHFMVLVPILLVLILPSLTVYFILWPSLGSSLIGGDKYSLAQALYTYLVVGFGEEISFRVIFQTYMERRFGNQRGIVLTALLFTICHIPSHILGDGLFIGSYSLMLVFYHSLLYGYIWFRTRNLWVIAGAHMLNNSTATIVYNLLN